MLSHWKWLCSLSVFVTWLVGVDCGRGLAEIHPQQLACGVYYGAAPDGEADMQKLRQLGVQHIIDLRSFQSRRIAKEQQLAKKYGMIYQGCEVGFRPHYPEANVEAVMASLRCKAHGTIYVHCTLGRDRTGLIVALYRQRYLGWPADNAYQQKKHDEFNGLLAAAIQAIES